MKPLRPSGRSSRLRGIGFIRKKGLRLVRRAGPRSFSHRYRETTSSAATAETVRPAARMPTAVMARISVSMLVIRMLSQICQIRPPPMTAGKKPKEPACFFKQFQTRFPFIHDSSIRGRHRHAGEPEFFRGQDGHVPAIHPEREAPACPKSVCGY